MYLVIIIFIQKVKGLFQVDSHSRSLILGRFLNLAKRNYKRYNNANIYGPIREQDLYSHCVYTNVIRTRCIIVYTLVKEALVNSTKCIHRCDVGLNEILRLLIRQLSYYYTIENNTCACLISVSWNVRYVETYLSAMV